MEAVTTHTVTRNFKARVYDLPPNTATSTSDMRQI